MSKEKQQSSQARRHDEHLRVLIERVTTAPGEASRPKTLRKLASSRGDQLELVHWTLERASSLSLDVVWICSSLSMAQWYGYEQASKESLDMSIRKVLDCNRMVRILIWNEHSEELVQPTIREMLPEKGAERASRLQVKYSGSREGGTVIPHFTIAHDLSCAEAYMRLELRPHMFAPDETVDDSSAPETVAVSAADGPYEKETIKGLLDYFNSIWANTVP